MSKKDILKEIVQKKKGRIILAKQNISEEELKTQVKDLPATRPFIEAINKPRQISLIAEIKKASPSSGIIRQDFNPQEIAKAYQDCGVQALSILTEEDFFQGNISFIYDVKSIVDLAPRNLD
jgi:indole-3-glycerol phosphate synthase